jgi:phage/plasmid-associated DNA primase
LTLAAKVREATQEYRSDEDLIAQWIGECCVTGNDNYRARASDLYMSFKTWCERGEEEVVSQKVFGLYLIDHGHERYTNNGTWYKRIALRGEPTEGTKPTEGSSG